MSVRVVPDAVANEANYGLISCVWMNAGSWMKRAKRVWFVERRVARTFLYGYIKKELRDLHDNEMGRYGLDSSSQGCDGECGTRPCWVADTYHGIGSGGAHQT